jgi:hypothetical protein
MTRRALATAALLALPLTILAPPAHADPGKGATVTNGQDGFRCSQDLVGEGSSTTDGIEVRSSSGVVTLICHFGDLGRLTDRTLRATGWPCFTSYGVTDDSSFVVTPSGKATMVCRIKPS